jgi:general secretion pathway protein H
MPLAIDIALTCRNPVTLRRRCGYTLVEMLVVLMIMGLLIGTISVIASPASRNTLQLEAQRLAQLLNLAAAESRASGKSFRWTSDGPGYRFLRWQNDIGWTEIRDNDLLRPRMLPSGITISSLRVENVRRQGQMQIEFTPHGLPLAFTIELASGDERHAVSASPVGEAQAQIRLDTAHAEVASR